MVSLQQGRVYEVSVVTTGSNTIQDHFIGDMVLYIADVSDYSDQGGQIIIEGVEYTYNTKDDELGTVSLATALTADVPDETRVDIYPPSSDKWALVEVDEGEDLIEARIPHGLTDKFVEGVRDPDLREPVLIRREDGESEAVIQDVSGVIPVIDGAYIDPATLPAPTPPPPEPPTVIPTPSVYGTIRGLAVSWEVIAGQNNWTEVHVSTDPAHVFVQGDPTTLAATETGLSTRIETDPATGTAMVASTDYYVALFAVNEVGFVGPSATVGPTQLHPVDTPDISANAAWVGTLDVDNLRDGNLTADVAIVGSLTALGANGEEVGMNADGFYVKGPIPAGETEGPTYVQFPTDGSKPNIFSGQLNASTLTVDDGSTLGGDSELPPEAVLSLAGKVSKPKNPPTVSTGWYGVNQDQIENSREWHGLAHNDSDGTWWSMWYRSKDDKSGLTQWDDAGNVLNDIVTGDARGRARGLVWNPINGGRFFTLRNAQGEAGWVDRLEIWDNSFTTQYESYDFRINYGMFWGGLGWDYVNNQLVYAYYNNQDTDPFSNGLPQSPIVFQHWSIDADSTIGVKTKTRKTVGSSNFAEGIASVDFGSFDFSDGVARYVIHLRSEHTISPLATRDRFLVIPDAEGAFFDDTLSWPNAGGYDVCGAHWDGANFHSIGALSSRWKYEGGWSYWTGDMDDHSLAWFFEYTWYDGNSAGSGTHETDPSDYAGTTAVKRSRPTVTVPAAPVSSDPDYPDRVRVYFADNETVPFTLMATLAPGATVYTADPSTAIAGAAPPIANTFPNVTSPGAVESAAADASGPFIKLSGDGSGRLGLMSWDNTGNILADFNKPYLSEYRANNLNVSNGGSATIINFGTTEIWTNIPSGGIKGNGDGSYTIQKEGKYLINTQISWDSNGTNRRTLAIWVNGSVVAESTTGDSNPLNLTNSTTKVMQLKVGDTVDIRCWQNSGASLAVIGGIQRTYVQMIYLAGGA